MTLYRVRDKHLPDKPGRVWGEHLSLADARKLKERVTGSGKSRTARLEPMEAVEKDAAQNALAQVEAAVDDDLERMRRGAFAAAAGAAYEAQAKHDARVQPRVTTTTFQLADHDPTDLLRDATELEGMASQPVDDSDPGLIDSSFDDGGES